MKKLDSNSGKDLPIQGIAGIILLLIFVLSIFPLLFGLIILATSVYLIGRQISHALFRRDRKESSAYVSIILAPLLSLFIIYLEIFSIIFSPYRNLSGLEAAFLYGSLIMTFIFLSGFLDSHREQYFVDENLAAFTRRLSISLVPFIFALFSATKTYLISLTYAFSFAGLLLVATTPFFYFVDGKKERLIRLSSFVISNRDFYLSGFALIGFLTGLYIQNSKSTFGDALIIIIFIAGIGIIGRGLYQGYGSLSLLTERNSLQIYEKFNKKENVSDIMKISRMGESIKEFEVQGNKERILIMISTYLSEAGFSSDEVEKFLKPILEYKLPVGYVLGIEYGRDKIRREIDKRTRIVDGLLRSIARSEKIYEQ